MKNVITKLLALVTMACLMVPEVLWAAGGGGGAPIVVVSDTRVIHGSIMRYFSNLYNTDILLFAIWAVVLTAAYGGFLGFLMDKLMGLTGLDLKNRKIVEH
ncbi:MAG: DVU0150 family protein [Desulfobacterales bacterium]